MHARNFKGTFNSLVAGFLETGETLEECVAREVKEETGLDVKNITYFSNQPWPYPSGLMVGFIADYAGGEINLQDEELSSGDFYTCLLYTSTSSTPNQRGIQISDSHTGDTTHPDKSTRGNLCTCLLYTSRCV